MNPKQLDQLATIQAILLDIYQDEWLSIKEKYISYSAIETTVRNSGESVSNNVSLSEYQSSLDIYCRLTPQLSEQLLKDTPDIPSKQKE